MAASEAVDATKRDEDMSTTKDGVQSAGLNVATGSSVGADVREGNLDKLVDEYDKLSSIREALQQFEFTGINRKAQLKPLTWGKPADRLKRQVAKMYQSHLNLFVSYRQMVTQFRDARHQTYQGSVNLFVSI